MDGKFQWAQYRFYLLDSLESNMICGLEWKDCENRFIQIHAKIEVNTAALAKNSSSSSTWCVILHLTLVSSHHHHRVFSSCLTQPLATTGLYLFHFSETHKLHIFLDKIFKNCVPSFLFILSTEYLSTNHSVSYHLNSFLAQIIPQYFLISNSIKDFPIWNYIHQI